jgi:hypothetical protein
LSPKRPTMAQFDVDKFLKPPQWDEQKEMEAADWPDDYTPPEGRYGSKWPEDWGKEKIVEEAKVRERDGLRARPVRPSVRACERAAWCVLPPAEARAWFFFVPPRRSVWSTMWTTGGGSCTSTRV